MSNAKTVAAKRCRKRSLQTTAAMANIAAENRIALGAPSTFSSGTVDKQASAPPSRSAPYKRETLAALRANMTENKHPTRKKGTADERYRIVRARMSRPLGVRLTCEWSTTSRTPTTASEQTNESTDPSQRVSHFSSQSRRTYANTPPAPSPSSAIEIDKKAKW